MPKSVNVRLQSKALKNLLFKVGSQFSLCFIRLFYVHSLYHCHVC